MKRIKTWKVFESENGPQFRDMIEDLRDLLLDFSDNGCPVKLRPDDEIKLNILRLKKKGSIESISIPFYIEIDINRGIIAQDEKRSGFGPLPEWFIDNCRRIEEFMKGWGYKTLPSVMCSLHLSHAADWEKFSSIDDLVDLHGLIYKVKLEFELIK